MSISVDWANEEKTLVIITFTGRWHWRDFDEMAKSITQMLQEVQHEVTMIFDFEKSSLYEPNMIEYIRKNYAVPAVTNWAKPIVVGVDYFTRVLWDGFTKLPFGQHYQVTFLDTIEDAITRFSSQV